jgi:hypothetical protein
VTTVGSRPSAPTVARITAPVDIRGPAKGRPGLARLGLSGALAIRPRRPLRAAHRPALCPSASTAPS